MINVKVTIVSESHPDALLRRNIEHLFNLRLHTTGISIFQINLKKCIHHLSNKVKYKNKQLNPTLLITGMIDSWASNAK